MRDTIFSNSDEMHITPLLQELTVRASNWLIIKLIEEGVSQKIN